MSTQSIAAALAPTGVLRVSINLGNPVLAQGDADHPTGVTVDVSRALAERIDVPVSFTCFDAARKSFDALRAGATDIAFLAIEPARAAEVWFSEPYVVIEGVFAVPLASSITSASEVDRAGVRVGVKEGSAYDLFLTRTLKSAEVVRGRDGIDVFHEQDLDVVAGIRQPLRDAASSSALRLVEPAFMQIRQAVATPPELPRAAREYVQETVKDLGATGFIADALARFGQDPAAAAFEAH